jgi:hypothetical protein
MTILLRVSQGKARVWVFEHRPCSWLLNPQVADPPPARWRAVGQAHRRDALDNRLICTVLAHEFPYGCVSQ